jgi:hypothetical protein
MSDSVEFSVARAVNGYLPLMHELTSRIELVAAVCDGKLGLTPPYAREYAYLQFRRMCELIALGCLQLHGDLPQAQTTDAKKIWNAAKIMRLLKKVHPSSFPQSVIRERVPPNEHHIQANAKPNALTYEEFNELYAECGEVLHRGTIRSMEAAGTISAHDYRKVTTWQSKIVDLMNEHIVGRQSGASYYLVSLRTVEGYPECSAFTLNGSGDLHVANYKLTISPPVPNSGLPKASSYISQAE